MANNNEYWQERQAQFWANLEKDESKIIKEVNKVYDKEAIRLEKEIASFYTKYGKDDIIEYQNLLQQLDREDAELLYRNYQEFAQKYPQYARLEDVRNNIYKLNRLEGLNESIKLQQMNIAAEKTEKVKGFLGNVFTRASDDIAKATGKQFNAVNNELLERTINQKWVGGKNFSERIWEDREKVANYLQNDIREAIVRGDSIQSMQKKMRERFNVSKSNAENLIKTESAYVMNESQALSFVEMGYEYYEILATLDKRTSAICQSQDGKRYKYSERAVGINYPPFHVRCRTTTLVVVDEYGTGDDRKRNNKIGSGIEVSNKAQPVNKKQPQQKQTEPPVKNKQNKELKQKSTHSEMNKTPKQNENLNKKMVSHYAKKYNLSEREVSDVMTKMITEYKKKRKKLNLIDVERILIKKSKI